MNYPKIKRITAVVTSVLIILTGIALIFSCLHLYFTGGEEPYSRERVGNYLTYPLIPSLPTLISVIFLGALSYISPEKERGVRVDLTRANLKRCYAKLDRSTIRGEAGEVILKEEKRRRVYAISTLFAVLAYTVLAAFIALDTSRYTKEAVNSDIVGIVLIILPLAVAVIGAVTVLGYLRGLSFERELSAVKGELSSGASLPSVSGTDKTAEGKRDFILRSCIRASVLLLGVVFIILGILNGGMTDVLGKAIKICTECIGLG